MEPARSTIDALLAGRGPTSEVLQETLEIVLAAFECATGTIHLLNRDTQLLELAAQRGIPDSIMNQVREIPIGKGMAGLAAQRLEPVQVCNLQKDSSGDVRPGARPTKMEGSIALPMLLGDELRGTIGVAKPVVYEFTAEEIAALEGIAGTIAARLA